MVRRMKITKNKIEKEIEFYKDCIEGYGGDELVFKSLAKCELLRGDIRKAQEYFRESDISWLEYLDHNKDYIKREWLHFDYLSSYHDRMFIICFAYGYKKAREYVKENLTDIERYYTEAHKWRMNDCDSKNAKCIDRALNDIAYYYKEVLLHSYVFLKDFKSASKIVAEILEIYEKNKDKEPKKHSKFSVLFHAGFTATIVKGMIEKDRKLFLKAMKDMSDFLEKTLEKDVINYANEKMILYSEMARQIWPDLVVDSLHVPEKLRSSSYFEELKTLGGTEE